MNAFSELHDQLTATPPHDEKAEAHVVASCLADPDCIGEVQALVKPGDFHVPRLASYYRAILDEYAKHGNVDPGAVFRRLRGDGADEDDLRALKDAVPGSGMGPIHAAVVHDHAVRRRIIETLAGLARQAYAVDDADPTDLAAEAAARLAELAGADREGLRELADVLVELAEHEGGETFEITPTPYPTLSAAWGGGMRSGNVYCLAGGTSCGKTTHALQFVRAAAEAGRRTLLVSLEMLGDEVGGCLAAMLLRQPWARVAKGRKPVSSEMRAELTTLAESAPPVMLYDRAATVRDVRVLLESCRARRKPVELLVVDHLHLMRPDDGIRLNSEERRFADIAEGLKRLSVAYRIPVLMLAQLNREHDHVDEPQLYHLKYSSAIEQVSSCVIMAALDGGGNPVLYGRKNRFGERDFRFADLAWHKSQWRIEEIETQPVFA